MTKLLSNITFLAVQRKLEVCQRFSFYLPTQSSKAENDLK